MAPAIAGEASPVPELRIRTLGSRKTPQQGKRRLGASMSLMQRFTFYRQRNAAPLAYYFARMHHVATHPQPYRVPTFLVVTGIDGNDHGKAS